MQKESISINEGTTQKIRGSITRPLMRREAKELFESEAICFGDQDGVPYFRIVELFGSNAAYHMARMMNCKGYFEPGREYNSWCANKEKYDVTLQYLYEAGFMKIVTNHNVILAEVWHSESEAGQFVDELFAGKIPEPVENHSVLSNEITKRSA